MAAQQRGLGSDNMSESDKKRIHEMGGKASHGGEGSNKSDDVIRNREGGGALDKAAQRKGGRMSHEGQ